MPISPIKKVTVTCINYPNDYLTTQLDINLLVCVCNSCQMTKQPYRLMPCIPKDISLSART